MDVVAIRAKIQKPISEDQPIGTNASEESSYEFIEEQMMKVGSLSHGTVQWKKVEQSSIELLSQKTKDLKLLIYLLQCFHNHNTVNSLTAALFVLSDFMESYWDTCYPFAGKKGELARRKFFNQIVQRFGIALDKLDFSQSNTADFKQLNASAECWDDVLSKSGYDSDDAVAIITKVKRKIRESKERAELDNKAKEESANSGPPPSQAEQNLEFDTTSSKSAKQTLLKMADFLWEQEDSMDLAIRLRRNALWSSITSLPDNTGFKTLVVPLPAERMKEYWDLLGQADLALWKRVETTLTMTPYWFDGQHLSYQIAEKLGYKTCAQGILAETQKFLKRLPEMYKLKFKDNTNFISNNCKVWLEEENSSNNTGRRKSKNISPSSWLSRKQKVTDLVKSDGLESALLMLNTEISKAEETRDSCYWRLISMELLVENNLKGLASQQLQQLLSEVESMPVSEWEPSLIKRIKKYTPVK